MKSVCRPRQIRRADHRAASLLLRNLPFFPLEEKERGLGGSQFPASVAAAAAEHKDCFSLCLQR